MADEKKPGKSGDNRNRRRYFRRKGGAQQTEPDSSPVRVRSGAPRTEGKVETPPPIAEQRSRNQNRRRRRSKGRRSGADARSEVVAAPIDTNEDYVAPTSVFIYTHTVRPDTRESYEFRSEHFSKVGRTLEDYNIDISVLFRTEESAASRIAAAFANFDMEDGAEEVIQEKS